MGKHGVLTGNSGLSAGGKFHLNAPYDNNGKVFVEVEDPEWGTVWERMEKEEAEAKNLPIIQCCQCSKPATSLDHLWPYYSGQNLCDDHEYNPDFQE